MYVIGLTGGIGCGKSTVAAMLTRRGALAIDADVVYRRLVDRPGPLPVAIGRAFGPDVLRPDGAVDRPALGRLVFGDPATLHRLEALTHPTVAERVRAILDADRPALAVVEAIKLLEAGWDSFCHAVWVVTCDPDRQRERLAATRGLSAADVATRVASQSSQSDLARRADVVLVNDGPLADLERQVDAALNQIPAGCETIPSPGERSGCREAGRGRG